MPPQSSVDVWLNIIFESLNSQLDFISNISCDVCCHQNDTNDIIESLNALNHLYIIECKHLKFIRKHPTLCVPIFLEGPIFKRLKLRILGYFFQKNYQAYSQG